MNVDHSVLFYNIYQADIEQTKHENTEHTWIISSTFMQYKLGITVYSSTPLKQAVSKAN